MMMGAASALIPGGHGGLILIGMPLLWLQVGQGAFGQLSHTKPPWSGLPISRR
jgi:hypothetical protein